MAKDKTKPSSSELTELGERFALEYVQDLNASAAYLRIKPTVKVTTAGQEGYKLLKNPQVARRIAELKAEQADRLKISADRVLQELAVCGFSDIGDYVIGDTGHVDLSPDSHKLSRRAVSSIKRKRREIARGEDEEPIVEYETEIKLWDKVSSLKALGQHLKLFDDEENRRQPVLIVKFVRE